MSRSPIMAVHVLTRQMAPHGAVNSVECFLVGRVADKLDKNSSGDKIANVNFLRRYGTYVLQNTKKENLLRLTN